MAEKVYYSIGEVAGTCNIPIKTLRYYDEIGLIVPCFRKEDSNYRYYSKEQMVTIFIIRKLRAIGFGLKTIKNIVSQNNAETLEHSIENRLHEVSGEIERLQEQYANGRELLQRIRKGMDILKYDKNIMEACHEKINLIQVEEIPERILVYSRKIMKAYKNADVSLERWIEILESAAKAKVMTKGPVMITYYGNLLDQFLLKDCDVEFSIEVEHMGEDKNFKRAPGFLAATALHVGKYSEIINTYIKMIQWINREDNLYQIAGAPTDEFIISPVDLPNVNEHITKIVIPIKKKQA